MEKEKWIPRFIIATSVVAILLIIFFVATLTRRCKPGEQWKLVWQDEFDQPGLPSAEKWMNEVGFIRNNELQYYTVGRQENARVENGYLILEARKEDFQGASYTSASLFSKANWTYGRIEVLAKLPQGKGLRSAIWSLGYNIDKVGWPACGEIDLLQSLGSDPDQITTQVYTKAYNQMQGGPKGTITQVPAISSDFHLFAIEWFKDRIDWYIDGQKAFTYLNDKKGSPTWPFDQSQYLLLNLSVGGDLLDQKAVDKKIFPQQFTVDYVRVYEGCKK